MAEQPTLNTDLEQALYRAALKEKKLRDRVLLSILAPAFVCGVWLIFSVYEVDTWRKRSGEIEKRDVTIVQNQQDAQRQADDAAAQKSEADKHAQEAHDQEKISRDHSDDMQQRLVKVREEIGGLGLLLADLSSARLKASRLNASEAVESELGGIRTTLGNSLSRIQVQIDSALQGSEQKARVYLFIVDDKQRDIANALKSQLESSGFDVAGIAKNSSRHVEATEVRYFREPQDKGAASQILAIVEKDPRMGGAKALYASDADYAKVGGNFQIWLGKPAKARIQ